MQLVTPSRRIRRPRGWVRPGFASILRGGCCCDNFDCTGASAPFGVVLGCPVMNCPSNSSRMGLCVSGESGGLSALNGGWTLAYIGSGEYIKTVAGSVKFEATLGESLGPFESVQVRAYTWNGSSWTLQRTLNGSMSNTYGGTNFSPAGGVTYFIFPTRAWSHTRMRIEFVSAITVDTVSCAFDAFTSSQYNSGALAYPTAYTGSTSSPACTAASLASGLVLDNYLTNNTCGGSPDTTSSTWNVSAVGSGASRLWRVTFPRIFTGDSAALGSTCTAKGSFVIANSYTTPATSRLGYGGSIRLVVA